MAFFFCPTAQSSWYIKVLAKLICIKNFQQYIYDFSGVMLVCKIVLPVNGQ